MKATLSQQLPAKLQAFKILIPTGAKFLSIGEMPRNLVEDQRYYAVWLYGSEIDTAEYATLYTVRAGEAFDDEGLVYLGQMGQSISLFMSETREPK